MIRLPSTTYTLQLILSAGTADVDVSYSDATTTGYTGGTQETAATATTQTICAAPAASTVRDIDFLSVKIKTTGGVVTVQKLNSSGAVVTQLISVTLLDEEELNYTHGSGWAALDANGNRKEVSSSVFSTLTVTGNATIGGTLGVTGGATFSAAITAANQIVSTWGNNQTLFNAASATTGYEQFNLQNTGSQVRFGHESSAGASTLPGSTAYSGFVGTVSNTPFHLFTNNAIGATLLENGHLTIGSTTRDTQILTITGSSTNGNGGIGFYDDVGADTDWRMSPGAGVGDTAFRLYNLTAGVTAFSVNATTNAFGIPGPLNVTGAVTFSNLAGVGTRTVVANASGVLSAP